MDDKDKIFIEVLKVQFTKLCAILNPELIGYRPNYNVFSTSNSDTANGTGIRQVLISGIA